MLEMNNVELSKKLITISSVLVIFASLLLELDREETQFENSTAPINSINFFNQNLFTLFADLNKDDVAELNRQRTESKFSSRSFIDTT